MQIGFLLEMKSDARCSIIKCPTAHEGQSESLRCGIQQAQADHRGCRHRHAGGSTFHHRPND